MTRLLEVIGQIGPALLLANHDPIHAPEMLLVRK
jgi:hypothetical protein